MSDLILDSLKIKNFRLFKHLEIERLGRVNLIVGKNGVGKTALLEAINLYGSRGSAPRKLFNILRSRDEIKSVSNQDERVGVEELINAIKNLFYGRQEVELSMHHKEIYIGQLQSSNHILSMKVGFFKEVRDEEGSIKLSPLHEGEFGVAEMVEKVIPGLEVQYGDKVPATYKLKTILGDGFFIPVRGTIPKFPTELVGANGLSSNSISELWDRAIRGGADMKVLDALRIIAPVKDLHFLGGEEGRVPYVSTKSENKRIPLRSMGDGMNRMLGIALALENAKDGILLIDEVETGLHYSAQPHMWRLVFETAEKLNVQVFATTHSLDCIRAFESAASERGEDESLLISLRRHRQEPEKIVAVLAGKDELDTIVHSPIEVR